MGLSPIDNGRSALKHPPYPKTPTDRAAYGSRRSWADQHVRAPEAYAEATAAKAYFQSQGWKFSVDELDFYLSNNPEGQWYEMSLDHQLRDVNHPVVEKEITKALNRLVDDAFTRAQHNDSILGATQELTSERWRDIEQAAIADDGDLKNSLGGHHVAVGAEIVIYGPQTDSGPYTAHVRYTPFIWDFYLFHGTAHGGVGGHMDQEMRELEEFGWARSFPVRGESIVREWSGPVGAK